MKDIKNSFINIILFLGISLFLLNCEQDDYLNLNQTNKKQQICVEKISIEEILNSKDLIPSLKKIGINLSNNDSKQKRSSSNFTISTKKILKATNKSSIYYSFLIEKPTDNKSDFENLVILKKRGNVNFYIYRYILKEDNGFKLNKELVDPDSFNLNNFSLKTERIYFDGICYWLIKDIDGQEIWYYIDCPGLTGGDSESLNPDSLNENGEVEQNEPDDNHHNGDGYSEPIDNSDVQDLDSGGGGGDSSSSPSSETTTIPIVTPSYEDQIKDCLEITESGNANYLTWLETASFYDIKRVSNYLTQNNCSTDAQNFVLLAIEALDNGNDVDFENQIIKTNPCGEIDKHLDINKGNIKLELNILKTKLDYPQEKGYAFIKDSNGNFINRQVVVTALDFNKVKIPTGNGVYAGAHTHTDELWNMFSWNDVAVLQGLYNDADMSMKSSSMLYLVARKTPTSPAEVYGIIVEDYMQLRKQLLIDMNEIDKQLKKLGQQPTLNDIIDKLNIRIQNKYMKSSDINFTFLNHFKNHGIKLFKGNSDLSNFSELTINPTTNTIIEIPCN